ncbi:MAG: hypothetical protein H0W63_08665 [Gemmatimonadaceae bacterium]|nr:hypothetical protein [Gemmatimonadaceae bacterium]
MHVSLKRGHLSLKLLALALDAGKLVALGTKAVFAARLRLLLCGDAARRRDKQ